MLKHSFKVKANFFSFADVAQAQRCSCEVRHESYLDKGKTSGLGIKKNEEKASMRYESLTEKYQEAGHARLKNKENGYLAIGKRWMDDGVVLNSLSCVRASPRRWKSVLQPNNKRILFLSRRLAAHP